MDETEFDPKTLKSIETVELLIRKERALEVMKGIGYTKTPKDPLFPNLSIESMTAGISQLQAQINSDTLSSHLLPQARIKIAAENARKNCLANTLLGTIKEFTDGSSPELLIFKNNEESTAFGEMLEAVEEGDVEGFRISLQHLLELVRKEFIYLEIPPKPPSYILPDSLQP